MAISFYELMQRQRGDMQAADRAKAMREQNGDIPLSRRLVFEVSPERQMGKILFDALMERFFTPDTAEDRAFLYGPDTTVITCVASGEDLPSDSKEYQINYIKPAEQNK